MDRESQEFKNLVNLDTVEFIARVQSCRLATVTIPSFAIANEQKKNSHQQPCLNINAM